MPLFDCGDTSVELDDHGFLTDPGQWSRMVAVALAADDGLGELNDEHWRLIHYLRDYQERHGQAPMIRVLVRESGLSLKRIYELFPRGPAKSACRVAGLPRPDSCV